MKNKNINYKALIVNVVICTISTFLSQFGVACYYGCGLGTDPISVFVDGIHGRFNLSYGTISTICYVILAVLLFIFERKHLGINTLVGVLFGGQLLDFAVALISSSFPLDKINLVTKILILLAGLIATGIGFGMSIACNLGVGTFQFIPLFISDYLHVELKYAQIISDATFFIIGWLLGGVVGIGSIVSVFLTGYILDWSLKNTLKFTESFGKNY